MKEVICTALVCVTSLFMFLMLQDDIKSVIQAISAKLKPFEPTVDIGVRRAKPKVRPEDAEES